MEAGKKLIDFYFSNYNKKYSTCSKKMATFQGSILPLSVCLAHGNLASACKEDALSLMMDEVFRRTYKKFRGKKRNLMKSRYLMNHARRITCMNLDIATRTYHRYLDEILQLAMDIYQSLMIEKAEYEKQLAFLASKEEQTKIAT